ncbi:hypothetical protein ACFWBV_34720 [Streptomyces sp. NPDC060030]|uniref:hypothetical protein n=1 Tax=Streptomyces sp. NPDC060030 TaxID=3347042 RepID=UPI0036B6B95D
MSVTDPGDVAAVLRPGETGLLVWHRHRQPGHAIAVHRTTDGVPRYIDAQAPAGKRVLTTLPVGTWDAADAHALIVGADGRVRADAIERRSEAVSAVRVLTDPAVDHRYGSPSLKKIVRGLLGPSSSDNDPRVSSASDYARLLSRSEILRLPDGTGLRDWTGRIESHMQFDFSHVYARQGDRFTFRDAPWEVPAVIISVDLAVDGLVEVGPVGGEKKQLSHKEFVDLLSADSLLSDHTLSDAPIVLWSEMRSPDLPRAIAKETGRKVWFHTDRLKLEEEEKSSGVWHLAFAWPAEGDDLNNFWDQHLKHVGEWNMASPGTSEAPQWVERTPSLAARKVVLAAKEMIGGLRWRGSSGPDKNTGFMPTLVTGWGKDNAFTQWLFASGPEPGSEGVMNCWEAVLFSAYRAGVVDKVWLTHIHEIAAEAAVQAGENVQDRGNDPDMVWAFHVYYTSFRRSLFRGDLSEYIIDNEGGFSGPDIPAGELVFFDVSAHVAISMGTRDAAGRQKVLSMWIYPRSVHLGGRFDELHSYGYFQETSVEELIEGLGPGVVVEFAAPSW